MCCSPTHLSLRVLHRICNKPYAKVRSCLSFCVISGSSTHVCKLEIVNLDFTECGPNFVGVLYIYSNPMEEIIWLLLLICS